jgi:transposase InsO family protein/transposase-like protein
MARPRKYSEELRERAVRFYFESDRPIAHVARDLGIHKEALRQWVRQAEADQGRRPELLTTSERDELKRLRKENVELRRANAILRTPPSISRRSSTRPGEGDRVCGGAAGCLRGRADLPRARRASEHALRAQIPEAFPRELADRQLLVEIESARSGYRRVYGARKTWLQLRRRGIEVGRDQVARVMREHRIEGKLRGRQRRTTIPDEAAVEQARDLLQRDFAATRANEKWVCDLTYLRTWNGFLYLAFILDCYSRRIVGWQLATHMRTELVLDALEMANGLCRPGEGLIAHSDRGSQYTSIRYTERLDEIGAAPSVGSRGDAYDNAMAEAWVATFKSELVDGRRFPSFEHAEHEVLHWIGFYNDERLHEALGNLPPIEYEELNIKTDTTPMVSAT